MLMHMLCFLLISFVCSVLGANVPYTFSATDKANLVKYHNFVRANWGVGPLTNNKNNADKIDGWNDNIAANALKWASGCVWEHSSDSFRNNGQWGENMAQQGGFPADKFPLTPLVNQVALWQSEEKTWDCTKTMYYDIPSGTSEDGCSKTPDANGNLPMCGHFTQIIWATTFEIGCGLVDCQDGTDPTGSDKTRQQFLVCQYNVAGNQAGAHALNPGSSTWNSDLTRISGSSNKCPGPNKPYYTSTTVSLTSEDTGVLTQDSGSHQSQAADGISVPMGAFVAVAVVCGLIVFLVILLVIAFVVVVSKKNNDVKSISLL
jgi:hypothetical protein